MQETDKTNVRDDDEINFLPYLIVLLKRKKMILGVTLAFAVITGLISLNMTPIFRAETKMLPPQQSSSSLSDQLLSQLGGAAGTLIANSVSVQNPNDIYVAMLQSRTIEDRIVDRFGLMKLYRAKSRQAARQKLNGSLTVTNGTDGIISVSVEDTDPRRAAEMANAFVQELKKLTDTLAVTEASRRALFLKGQLGRVKEDLAKAEDGMQEFQEQTGAVKIDTQAEAVVESIAQLQAQIAAKEVGIQVMRTYTQPRNPDFQRAEAGLRGMKEQLRKLEGKSSNSSDPLLPTGKMARISTAYVRKLRELKYQETMFDLMSKQYEAARMDEATDPTVIQVLDKAVPPEKKVKPERRVMVMVATFIGFFVAVFAAFFLEYAEKLSADEKNRDLLEALKRYASFRRRRT